MLSTTHRKATFVFDGRMGKDKNKDRIENTNLIMSLKIPPIPGEIAAHKKDRPSMAYLFVEHCRTSWTAIV